MQPDSARVQGSDWIISALRRILVLAYPLTSDPPTTAPLAVARPSTTGYPLQALKPSSLTIRLVNAQSPASHHHHGSPGYIRSQSTCDGTNPISALPALLGRWCPIW